MNFATNRLVMAGACAAALAAAGCAGLAGPTSPSSSSVVSGSAVTAGAIVSSASSHRSGDLHMTKDCMNYGGKANDACVITASNIDAIEAGSNVVYAQALNGTTLDSDVVLNPPKPGNNLAFGHCHVDLVVLATGGVGLCTFSGGTGQFTHFHASATVSQPDPNVFVFAWDGTYSFDPRD